MPNLPAGKKYMPTPKKKTAAKPTAKKPAATTKSTASKPAATPTYTRKTGGKGFKGTTKPTVSTTKALKEAGKYVPNSKSIKSAAKSIPSTAKKGLSAIIPDFKLPGGGKNTGDWKQAESYVDKKIGTPKQAVKKVQQRGKKAGK